MKRQLWKAVILVAVLAIAGQAHAVAIDPTSGVLNTSRWEGNDTSQAAINAAIEAIMGSLNLLYKQDAGPGSDTGLLAGSYATVLNGDLSGGTITYGGGDYAGPPVYLLVKDGNQEPAWYLFNLTLLGWNGTDTITLSNFWPANGAISHVALYGPNPIPEPGTMLLLGSGLVGLAGWGRKKFRS